jgi:hypothetical protein
VRRAVEYRSGAVYAAKEFFKTSEHQNFSEIETLQRLSHVRAD